LADGDDVPEAPPVRRTSSEEGDSEAEVRRRYMEHMMRVQS